MLKYFWALILALLLVQSCTQAPEPALTLQPNDRIALIGGNLCSRMLNFGDFETALHLRYPDYDLFIRNMCDGGDTPGFRPHSARDSAWAFPGARDYQDEYAQHSDSEGFYPSPDEWLTDLEADIIVAFFGYSESFAGQAGLRTYRAELDSFINYTLRQQYNGEGAPQLVLVSPTAFQDLSDRYDLPNGETENERLALYTTAMREVAAEHGIPFVDAFTPSRNWFAGEEQLTTDGVQLNAAGYQRFGDWLADALFGDQPATAVAEREQIQAAVQDKNWYWHNEYKIPNGVHAWGRRYDPFGPDNYPMEKEKVRQMTLNRDTAIWRTARGESYDLAAADARTRPLPPVETNYDPGDDGEPPAYRYGADALATLETAPGYRIELFASEEDFPDLANPVQLSFDNQGRLWVATMPTYPHWRPGDPRPDDKLLILEDTDNDGRADKQTVFADGLHLPVGFELAPEGVYVSQGTNLKLLTDTDGDDHADREEIIYSGFDDHDTHHVISAFCADPSGAIYMGEGVFLHTNVETPYGTVRATNGGFYRYAPQRRHLERTAQIPIPNPWGIAFDDWGQPLFAETSGPDVRWMMPSTIRPRYGVGSPKSPSLVEEAQRVRPTSGVEFVSSRHFPPEVQGDWLLNNTIGFLGTKQHTLVDEGTGFASRHRQDLVVGSDPNFRPVDMEFAPDGSLYLVDWHNVLIGHMQHNARDPLRDHVHGRIYRITYPGRPLVRPAFIAGAPIDTLLENLKLPEYRTRYRTRRELRGRSPEEVLPRLREWVNGLSRSDPAYEHHLLEALWVTWGLNRVDQDLLRQVLQAEDFRARAAAVRVLRYTGHQVADQAALLRQAAADPHGRVRLEAIVAASWLEPAAGNEILTVAASHPLDDWMTEPFRYAEAHLNGKTIQKEDELLIPWHLEGEAYASFMRGQLIYRRDGFCGTCHQPDGGGLASANYPPLDSTRWVNGSPERLIKLTLKGLHGPIEVLGKPYPGEVPMTPYGGMLDDQELADVLTFVRNAFSNRSSVILPDQVAKVRAATAEKTGFYSPAELLAEHPHDEPLE
jgi:mono/diheme cytochrome c family protein/glucose/arabinose dehydrogenase